MITGKRLRQLHNGELVKSVKRYLRRVQVVVLTLLVWQTNTWGDERSQDSTLRSIERLNPHLRKDDPRELPLKVRTLMQDEYTFFRGTIDLFYEWTRKNCPDWFKDGIPTVLLHGDVHLGNVGTYQSIGKRGVDLGFGLVDLDEVFEGPFQLDLLRAATALRCAIASNEVQISDEEFKSALNKMVESYRETLRSQETLADAGGDLITKFIKKTRDEKLADYVAKYADDKPEPRFKSCRLKKDTPSDIMQSVDATMRGQIVSAIWSSFQESTGRAAEVFGLTTEAELNSAVKDAVRWTRVESSGSQGLHKYLVLLATKSSNGDGELLILELKQEPTPAPERAGVVKSKSRSTRASEVADAHRNLFEPDPWFVTHTRMDNREFIVRLRDPWGEELEDDMVKTPKDVTEFAEILGKAVGQAHRNILETRSDPEAKRGSINAASTSLASVLQVRSHKVEQFLRKSFDSLSEDPLAQQYAERVESFLGDACPKKPN